MTLAGSHDALLERGVDGDKVVLSASLQKKLSASGTSTEAERERTNTNRPSGLHATQVIAPKYPLNVSNSLSSAALTIRKHPSSPTTAQCCQSGLHASCVSGLRLTRQWLTGLNLASEAPFLSTCGGRVTRMSSEAADVLGSVGACREVWEARRESSVWPEGRPLMAVVRGGADGPE